MRTTKSKTNECKTKRGSGKERLLSIRNSLTLAVADVQNGQAKEAVVLMRSAHRNLAELHNECTVAIDLARQEDDK